MITALQTLEYLEDQMGQYTELTLLSLVENPYYKNWNIFGYQTGNENDPYGTEQLLLGIFGNYYGQVNVQGDYLKVLEQIKAIVDTSYYKYQKLYDTLNFKYDPIVNYDRTDTETTLLNRSNVDTTTDDDRQYETDERIKRTTRHKNKISTYKSTYDSENPILTDETRYTNGDSDYTIEETKNHSRIQGMCQLQSIIRQNGYSHKVIIFSKLTTLVNMVLQIQMQWSYPATFCVQKETLV